jgi:transcriptional regulator GlxA family with amidase domain
MRDIVAFMERHLAEPLPVPRLARRAGLSRFHVIRAFRAATGQTPYQFLKAKRIARAQELLATTPLTVTDICERVGFQSLGSFVTAFRRATGATPTAYRATHRKNAYIPVCFVRMYRADR